MSAGWAAFAAVLGAERAADGFLAAAGLAAESRPGPPGLRGTLAALAIWAGGYAGETLAPSVERQDGVAPVREPRDRDPRAALLPVRPALHRRKRRRLPARRGGRLRGAGPDPPHPVLGGSRASTTRSVSAVLGHRRAAGRDRRALVPRPDGALVPPDARGHGAHPAGHAPPPGALPRAGRHPPPRDRRPVGGQRRTTSRGALARLCGRRSTSRRSPSACSGWSTASGSSGLRLFDLVPVARDAVLEGLPDVGDRARLRGPRGGRQPRRGDPARDAGARPRRAAGGSRRSRPWPALGACVRERPREPADGRVVRAAAGLAGGHGVAAPRSARAPGGAGGRGAGRHRAPPGRRADPPAERGDRLRRLRGGHLRPEGRVPLGEPGLHADHRVPSRGDRGPAALAAEVGGPRRGLLRLAVADDPLRRGVAGRDREPPPRRPPLHRGADDLARARRGRARSPTSWP